MKRLYESLKWSLRCIRGVAEWPCRYSSVPPQKCQKWWRRAQHLNERRQPIHRWSPSMIVSMLDCVLLLDVISNMFY